MPVAKTIARNTFFLLTARVVSMLLSFILLVVVARELGVELFGLYNFAFAFVFFFAMFAEFGLPALAVREVAKQKKKISSYFSNILYIRLFFVAIASGLLFILINVFSFPSSTQTIVYIVAAAFFVQQIANSFRYYFQSFQIMEYEAIPVTIQSIAYFSFGLLVLFAGFTISSYEKLFLLSLVLLLSNILSLVLSAFLAFAKLPKISFKPDLKLCNYILKNAFPFLLIVFLVTLYTKANIVFLEHFHGSISVGVYSASYLFISSIIALQTNFLLALYPAISEFFQKSKEKLFQLFHKSLKYLAIAGLPIAFFGSILARYFLLPIYGTEFLPAIPVFQILVWTIPFVFVNGLFYYLLFAAEKQKVVVQIFAIVAISSLALNFLLIPEMKEVGASIVLLFSEVIAFSLTLLYVSLKIFKTRFIGAISRPFLSALIAGLLVLLLKGLNIFIIIVIAVPFYYLLLVKLKAIDSSDFEVFKKIFSRKVI